MSKGLSYRDAGVDIEAGDALVEAIKPFARRTLRPEVLAGIGGVCAALGPPEEKRPPGAGLGPLGGGTQPNLGVRPRWPGKDRPAHRCPRGDRGPLAGA